jgi:hypothetical protein
VTLLLVALILALIFCALALVMTLVNLRIYGPPPASAGNLTVDQPPLISVCVPARNEERNLEACVRSLLDGGYPNLEVLVYNDHSTDRTGTILQELIAADRRVRAVAVEPLPQGWNGKQFACDRMGHAAAGDWLLFTDADVRFEPGCLAQTVLAARRLNVDLLSTFPRQICGSLAELAIVPMIFFILFSYLPMARMRGTADPASSAGCGQFLFARREAYLRSGGHSAFADSMHDGIRMPRAFRSAGFRTDLFDGTLLCSVRMYTGLRATWRGFAKNAYEGLGSITLLALVTFMHLVGHVLPWVVLLAWCINAGPEARHAAIASVAIVLALAQRAVLTRRFAHPSLAIPLHPLGVLLMTAIQWHSFYLHMTGQRAWRGRTLAPAGS